MVSIYLFYRMTLSKKSATSWDHALDREESIRAKPAIRAQAPALLPKGNKVSLKAFSVRDEKSTWMNLSA